MDGKLAVARALGDFQFKSNEGIGACEQAVSPEPDVVVHTRSKEDEVTGLG